MKNKQLVITQFSESLATATAVVEQDISVMGDEDVIIKNLYLGINAIYDRELYRGRVPYIDIQFPYVFGVEAVGIVMEVGGKVDRLKAGDAVSTVKVGTAYQEYQQAHMNAVASIPEASPEYLALNPTGVSAHLALEKTAELKEGETIVVSAASGGLGHIVVQLAKKKNCHVVAICGRAKKVKLMEDLGVCDRIINYREEDISSVLKSEYRNKIDVGFDSVGTYMFDALLEHLAPLGRLVVCGLATELSVPRFQSIQSPRVYEKIYWKGASVRCFMNHLYREEHPASRKLLFKLYENEKLKVKVDSEKFYGIESIIAASQYLLDGKSCGKVVVRL